MNIVFYLSKMIAEVIMLVYMQVIVSSCLWYICTKIALAIDVS
jgi:hypothetical protein